MSKGFAEVFPTLKLTEPIRELMNQTVVDQVTATKKQDLIRIYLHSPNLIAKSDLYRVEDAIRKQLFPGVSLSVRIRERFVLSSQYTPENLLDSYKDSILLELKSHNPVLYTVFKNAEISFSNEKVVVSLEEGILGHSYSKELCLILDRILNERCGLSCAIETNYVQREKAESVAEDSWEKKRKEVRDRQERAAKEAQESAEGGSTEAKRKDDPASSTSGRQTGTGTQTSFRNRRGRKGGQTPKSTNPALLYGKEFDGEIIPLRELDAEPRVDVCIHGQIFSLDVRITKTGKHLYILDLTDFTDSITVKVFVNEEQNEEFQAKVKKGAFVKLKGVSRFDSFDKEVTISSVSGILQIPDFTVKRMDMAPDKRVELHCHTKMSNMDGVSEVKDIIKRAYAWGMPGIAITDHGVVQALTDANHVYEDLYKEAKKAAKEAGLEAPDRQNFFKIVPGVECYLVDDKKEIVTNEKGQRVEDPEYVVFDLETTGFSPLKNRIIEIGAVKIRQGKIVDRFSEFVNPKVPIPFRIRQLTSITDEMVMDAGTRQEILPRFAEFIRGSVLVGHNVSFDVSFIKQNFKDLGIAFDYTSVDTVGLSRVFFPTQARHTLNVVYKTITGHEMEGHHRAVNDAECTAEIFLAFLPMLAEKKIEKLGQINGLNDAPEKAIKHLRPHHCILLAKNTKGRVNLYTLVSKSHLEYFHRYPLVPKSVLEKYREGLIVGSACCAGELFEAVEEERSEEEIAKLVSFYDYLEVQPIGNNAFMIDAPKHENVHSEEDLRELNRKIVKLGEQFNKRVVATCDVHFLDPQDEIYRTIIQAGRGMEEESSAPLYLHTTEEMLNEFAYLGEKKAKEIVIDHPREILDMCDSISPVRPDKCAPVIENSDGILKHICYTKAHEIYGDPLPEIVEERLQRELHSIISNGFAVMYIIAQKLVWKSVEDGYLVGSRGSVGSSFVAFTAGITEVNSLPPHYVCPSCKYSDFDSEEVRAYAGNSGCDMSDKICPHCGAKLKKDGFDIPFETFLGFKGDKEPDIDLNFSGEYQSKAHKYTEVIFGAGQTFRAGTIAALADKTAYGYVKKYFDSVHEEKRRSEINRLVLKCTGIRTGTGQHPGGIIVLPVGQDINSFTPVQHPANKDIATVTTHYDYHSIDHNLLKLDILGHDDPTMIRFLQDVTDIDPTEVPLDDRKVMTLWQSTEALGLTPKQISGTKLGCLGLPEFGTDFAMQMVIDAKPTSFSHLIRISGLSHGTDVWLGNAKDLIMSGQATIDTAICCRDDIMIYLIQKGMDKSLSFKTMESVRKGKGLQPEMKEAMKEAQVPEWYIESCLKIKYMFPKAHAAAYVMMAWRIAWFKVYYPAAFYAAWFSIRAKAFSYEDMCQGEAHLHQVMEDFRNRKDELTNTEALELQDMRLVEEMYERGIEFMPLDLFRAKARSFQVIDGKIMPSLQSIDGMGPIAAIAIEEAVKGGSFLSRDEFREKTKCPQAVMDKLTEIGLLSELPQSNQISIFDL